MRSDDTKIHKGAKAGIFHTRNFGIEIYRRDLQLTIDDWHAMLTIVGCVL
jgi:hypothetical protein